MLVTIDHSATCVYSFELTNQYDRSIEQVVAQAERMAKEHAEIDGYTVGYIVLRDEWCGEAAHHYTFEVYGELTL